MRPAPGSIPDKMPDVDKVNRNLVHLTDAPRERLAGYSISGLVQAYTSGSVWLTGSTVWLPAVFDVVDHDTDADLVFADSKACTKFVDSVLAELNAQKGGYYLERSGRICHPDGKNVIDAWSLQDDETIEEVLMAYPHDYQRAAFFMSWGAPTACSLTRIIKLRKRTGTNVNAVNLFSRIEMSRSSY